MRLTLLSTALLLSSLLLLTQACSQGEATEATDAGSDQTPDRTLLSDLRPDRPPTAGDQRVDTHRPDAQPHDTLDPDAEPDPCGDGVKEGTEACDDGNQLDSDGCSNSCELPGGHLLITEIAVSPVDAEFMEIYNPGPTTVVLDNIYLADRSDYFLIPEGALPGGTADFVARFPAGATIEPGQYLTIAMRARSFRVAYAHAPDYELQSSDDGVPDMASAFAASSTISSNAGFADSGELLMLFAWDGAADLVQDIDYILWATSSPAPASKTTLYVDGPDSDTDVSYYLDDTLPGDQSSLRSPNQGGSLHRCNYHEQGETQSGGNGIDGHDETSEPFEDTWVRNPSTSADRTPGETAPLGLCPTS